MRRVLEHVGVGRVKVVSVKVTSATVEVSSVVVVITVVVLGVIGDSCKPMRCPGEMCTWRGRMVSVGSLARHSLVDQLGIHRCRWGG